MKDARAFAPGFRCLTQAFKKENSASARTILSVGSLFKKRFAYELIYYAYQLFYYVSNMRGRGSERSAPSVDLRNSISAAE